MADFTYKNSQTLTPAQVTALWQQIGAPSSIANVFGTNIAQAEGGYQTGVVLNTAYPTLPNYTPPAAGDSPEYSVGLYGLNLYGDMSPTPTASQAYSLGQKIAANPLYQTMVAAGMFNSRGFAPWTDSYVSAQGGPTSLLTSLGYSTPPQIPKTAQLGTSVPTSKQPIPSGPNPTGSGSGSSGSGSSGSGSSSSGSGSSGSGSSSSSSTSTPSATGCAIKWPSLSIPVVGTLGGGCLLGESTVKKIEGAFITLGGAILMVVGGFMLFGGSAVSNLSSALRSIGNGQVPKPVKAGPTSSQPSAPSLPDVEEPSVPETPDYDEELNDSELRAYYQGVNDGLQAPRRPRKTVGVYHDAVGPGEDDF